jgi:hypothetical protein
MASFNLRLPTKAQKPHNLTSFRRHQNSPLETRPSLPQLLDLCWSRRLSRSRRWQIRRRSNEILWCPRYFPILQFTLLLRHRPFPLFRHHSHHHVLDGQETWKQIPISQILPTRIHKNGYFFFIFF